MIISFVIGSDITDNNDKLMVMIIKERKRM